MVLTAGTTSEDEPTTFRSPPAVQYDIPTPVAIVSVAVTGLTIFNGEVYVSRGLSAIIEFYELDGAAPRITIFRSRFASGTTSNGSTWQLK